MGSRVLRSNPFDLGHIVKALSPCPALAVKPTREISPKKVQTLSLVWNLLASYRLVAVALHVRLTFQKFAHIGT